VRVSCNSKHTKTPKELEFYRIENLKLKKPLVSRILFRSLCSENLSQRLTLQILEGRIHLNVLTSSGKTMVYY
jgi:hypothetical protein